jgi:hypothetical protein
MKGYATMKLGKILAVACAVGLVATACGYIVPPIEEITPPPAFKDLGWAGTVNGVSSANGGLHVDLSIENRTGDFSAMDVTKSKASVTSGGSKTDCGTVFVGTSPFVNNAGWFIPSGFAMSGYTKGPVTKQVKQALYVECAGVSPAAGQKLVIDYTYITGPFNYYVASDKHTAEMTLDLGKVVKGQKYPVSEANIGATIEKFDAVLEGINHLTVQLKDAKRTDTGLEFTWEVNNPIAGQDHAYMHIGYPPVLGSDGILYGPYVSPHQATYGDNGTDLRAPALGKVTFTTTVTVPKEVTGLYVIVPEETKQAKYFVDHVIDITNL